MNPQNDTHKPKIMILGLDAATFDLIEPWAEQGYLPTIASLMRDGAYGPLRSVPNLNSASAWSTFATGKNPGKHGIFWFYEHQPNSYEFRYLSGADNPEPRFWNLYSDAGRSAAVLNVPMSYPASPLNGVMIAGMETPSENAPGFTYPECLRQEIASAVPNYRIESDVVVLARSGRWDQAIQALQEVVEARICLAEYLLQHNTWDLFVAVFTALDRVQHVFWRHMNPDHPDYDANLSPKYENTILEFYRLMDQAISKLIRHCDENTYVMLVSDHGMGYNQMGSFFLNPLLEKMGLFCRSKSIGRQSLGQAVLHWLIRDIAPVIEGWIPRQMRKKLIAAIPGGRAKVTRELHQNICDWNRTQAYTDYVRPELWINLKGRNPQGIVEPGQAYENLREQLIDTLKHCIDAETGKPLVHQVLKREQVYWGPQLHKAPDLIIEWNYDVIVKGVRGQDAAGKTFVISEQDQIVERRDVSGDHRPDGIFLLNGPGVKPGYVSGQGIEDIAPTALYLAGLQIPEDMDGSVIVDVLQKVDLEAAAQRTPATKQENQEIAAAGLSIEDETAVEERLRSLGYL